MVCLALQDETRDWFNKYASHEVYESIPNVWKYAGATGRDMTLTHTVASPLHKSPSLSSLSRSHSAVLAHTKPSVHDNCDFVAGKKPGLSPSYVLVAVWFCKC